MSVNVKVRKATPKEVHAIYTALEEGWDKTAGTFRPGWSDVSIAARTGAPLASIARIRVADFGKLVEGRAKDTSSADIDVLRSTIATLDGTVIRLAGRVAVLEEVMEALVGPLPDPTDEASS